MQKICGAKGDIKVEDLKDTDSHQPIIKRYGPPGKLDCLPKGSLCKLINSNSKDCIIYEQTSGDQENPHWEIKTS